MVKETDSELSSYVIDDSEVERLESSENNAESSDSEINAVLLSSESDPKLSPETARVWCIEYQDDVAPPRFPFSGTPGTQVDSTDEMQPLDFFELYFDDMLLDMICTETTR